MIGNQDIGPGFSFVRPAHKPHPNPPIRSVVLDICARHGAQRILGIGRNTEALCHHFRHAGYSAALVNPRDGGESSAAQSTSISNPLSLIDPSPVRGAPFDLAISIESHETFIRPAIAVETAAAKLGRGGVYIVSTPYGDRGLGSVFRNLFRCWKCRKFSGLDKNSFQCWSRPCLTKVLKSHKFTIVESVGVRNPALQWEAVLLVARKNV
jgi:hypothetical protein